MSAIAGGAAIGAGVGLSSVALMPFNAANTFLGSAFFGYGMILGERYMYQADWPKIQQRLENGEKIENIIQEYTGTFTAVVMKEAKIIFDSVTNEMAQIIANALGLQPPGVAPPPPPTTTPPVPPPIIGGISQPPVSVPQVIIHPKDKIQNKKFVVSPNVYCTGRMIWTPNKTKGGANYRLEANHAIGTRNGRWVLISGGHNDSARLFKLGRQAWPSPLNFQFRKDQMFYYWAPDLSR